MSLEAEVFEVERKFVFTPEDVSRDRELSQPPCKWIYLNRYKESVQLMVL